MVCEQSTIKIRKGTSIPLSKFLMHSNVLSKYTDLYLSRETHSIEFFHPNRPRPHCNGLIKRSRLT
jgi:hypothetical protein